MLYCNSCHCGISDTENSYMVRGKRICERCYQKINQASNENIEKAKQNDKFKEQLFSFLLSSFPISSFPESWNFSLESMLKKGLTYENILFTLKYIRSELGKEFTEENWISLIYVYYNEAILFKRGLDIISDYNRKKTLSIKTQYYAPRETTFYDEPDYRIEDL